MADKNVDEIISQLLGNIYIAKIYREEAKRALLKLLLESLPERKTSDGIPSRDGFNTALDQTSEAIKRLFE